MKYIRALLAWINIERFSVHVKSALCTAEAEAARLGKDRIDTEHLLVGALGEIDGTAVKILQQLSCDLTKVRNELGDGGDITSSLVGRRRLWIPQTPAAKRVIAYAVENARVGKAPSTGTEHLLLGFFREPGCRACQLLADAGVTLGAVRAAVNLESGTSVEAGSP